MKADENNVVVKDTTLADLAVANNLKLLDKDEKVYLKKEISLGKNNSKEVHSFDLGDDIEAQVIGDKKVSLSTVYGSPDMNVFVIPDSLATYPSKSKIKKEVFDKVEKDSNVPIIIKFANLEDQYIPNSKPEEIKKKKDKFEAKKTNLEQNLGDDGKIEKKLEIINSVSAKVNKKGLEKLVKNPDVASVELDDTVSISLDTSVNEIKANEVRTIIDNNGFPLDGTGKKIGIIDTGVDYTHADLGGCFGGDCKVAGGYDFINNDSDPKDDHGHGTHVAATAAGKGLLMGVAPGAKIYAYKVLGADGYGYSSSIIAAIQSCTDPNNDGNPEDHLDVCSMSLGGDGDPDDSKSLAVDNSSRAGVFHSVAAGNSGPGLSTISSPGTARTAMTVAASCQPYQIGTNSRCTETIANFSSRGPLVWNGQNLSKPDISAPGVSICAARSGNAFPSSPTCLDDTHVRISGTSMATPHIAGVAAMVRQAYPSLTPEEVKQKIKSTAVSLDKDANLQGAGLVDVTAAIPFPQKVKSTPSTWNLTSDPTTKTNTSTQSFSTSKIDNTINSTSIRIDLDVPGISMVADKSSLQFNNGADTFSLTVTIDNDIAKAGNYNGRVFLEENSQLKGGILIIIAVKPTFLIESAKDVDYGVDNPELPTWTSENKPFKVTNLRKDVAQTISVSTSSYPIGINYVYDNSLTVPANSFGTINTHYVVDNSLVKNSVYKGTISIKNGPGTTSSFNTSFTKYYVLVIEDPVANDPDRIAYAWVYDQKNTSYQGFLSSSPYKLYLNAPGPYDVGISHEDIVMKNIVKENVSLADGDATVSINEAEATNLITMNGKGIDNENFISQNLVHEWTHLPSGKTLGWYGQLCFSGEVAPSFCDQSKNYYSNFSQNYQHDTVYYQEQPLPRVYAFMDTTVGLTSNLTTTNSPADLKKTEVIFSNSSAKLPLIQICQAKDAKCFSAVWRNQTLSLDKQTIYTTLSKDYYLNSLQDYNKIGCSPSEPCATAPLTTGFIPATNERYLGIYPGQVLPSYYGDKIYNGFGPVFWTGKFQNSSNNISLKSIFPGRFAFMTQDYGYEEAPAVPYQILQNGNQIASGDLPEITLPSSILWGTSLINQSITPGTFELKIDSYPYWIRGQKFNAKVSEKFNTTLEDRNPPAISRFYLLSNNARSEIYNENVENRIEYELDPVEGTIANTSLSYSLDGINFTPLTSSNQGGSGYTVALPKLPSATKLILKLDAADDSGNSLSYTFEVPRGEISTATFPDTANPALNISSPTTAKSIPADSTVEVQAFDNFGVSKVELYKDGSLLGTKTTSPYVFNLSLASGTTSVKLQAKAYDAAGNMATSVEKQYNSDSIGPAVNITSPTNGSSVSGSVAISASATDSSGVKLIQFYLDNTILLGQSYSSTYTMQWNSSQSTQGDHTISAKAFDNTGNSTTTSITVKVANIDLTPPSVAITSPLNNAILKRGSTTTISVDAKDNVAVSKVILYVNNKAICTDSSAPYQCLWVAPRKRQSITIQAKAYDTKGNLGISPIIKANVE